MTSLNFRLSIWGPNTLITSFRTILPAWGAVFSTTPAITEEASRTPWLTLGCFRSKLRFRRQWNGYSLCESAKRVRALYCGSPWAWLWETPSTIWSNDVFGCSQWDVCSRNKARLLTSATFSSYTHNAGRINRTLLVQHTYLTVHLYIYWRCRFNYTAQWLPRYAPLHVR